MSFKLRFLLAFKNIANLILKWDQIVDVADRLFPIPEPKIQQSTVFLTRSEQRFDNLGWIEIGVLTLELCL